MFENVLVAGDSFSVGTELNNRENRYSTLISKAYNAREYNFGGGGLDNELISSYFISETLSLISKNLIKPENTLVLISWSYLGRFNFYNKYNDCFIVSTGTRYFKRNENVQKVLKLLAKSNYQLLIEDLEAYFNSHNNLYYSVYNTLKYIYYTQLFLDSYKFKYIFLFPEKNIFDILTNFEYNFGTNNIVIDITRQKLIDYHDHYYLPDFMQFLNKINFDNFFNTYIVDFAKKNNFDIGVGFHPLDKAHEAYSKLLLEHIKNKWDVNV